MLFFQPSPPPDPPLPPDPAVPPPPPPPTQTTQTEYTPEGATHAKVPAVVKATCPTESPLPNPLAEAAANVAMVGIYIPYVSNATRLAKIWYVGVADTFITVNV
jgi:hypothetical protein